MLSTKMLPPVGVLVPIYLIFRDVGLLDTRTGLIIIYTLMNLPIVVWMLYTFFKDMPKDILEAGRMDGASTLQEVFFLLLPLTLPGIASTGLLSVILSWNEAFWSLNLTSSKAAPLTAYIASFSSPEGCSGPSCRRLLPCHRPHSNSRLDDPKTNGARPDLWRRQVKEFPMATLQLKNITKQFGDTKVIKGIDLDVNDREFVVFVGPSGCGKSTLMRMIAGLESASDGDILIDGKRMNEVGPADRGLAMVFQATRFTRT